jgi:hypothetical protein
VERVHGAFPVVNSPAKWIVTPAKARPPRLQKFKPDASAAERLQAVMQTELRTGEVLTGISPDAAAQALLDYLQREGIFSRTLTNESSGENT